MAQNWDYAELSKDAKVAGGPEKYVEMLELASKEAGKMEMLPYWLRQLLKLLTISNRERRTTKPK